MGQDLRGIAVEIGLVRGFQLEMPLLWTDKQGLGLEWPRRLEDDGTVQGDGRVFLNQTDGVPSPKKPGISS